jgi:hypothetical protein
MRPPDHFLRPLVATMMLTGLVSAASTTVAITANATGAPLCSAQKLTGQSSRSSRPGGNTVRLVMTSSRFPTCTWSNLTGYQFLSITGAGVGPVVRATGVSSSVARKPVYDTFQIVQNVVTMAGVQCTLKSAASVQVITPDKRSVRIALHRVVEVCVGGTTKWTMVDPPEFPVAARCTTASIKMSIGPADGTAGTTYLPLRFTNVGSPACYIAGTPVVQPLSGALVNGVHVAVGPKARTIDLSSSGSGNPIRLVHGDVASAPFGVVETGNFTPSKCGVQSVQSLRISLAAGAHWWLPATFSVCTKLASTTISGVVPSADGVVPLN